MLPVPPVIINTNEINDLLRGFKIDEQLSEFETDYRKKNKEDQRDFVLSDRNGQKKT